MSFFSFQCCRIVYGENPNPMHIQVDILLVGQIKCLCDTRNKPVCYSCTDILEITIFVCINLKIETKQEIYLVQEKHLNLYSFGVTICCTCYPHKYTYIHKSNTWYAFVL